LALSPPGAKKMVENLVIIRNAQMLNMVKAFIEKRKDKNERLGVGKTPNLNPV
jgi:hypothetical protein